MVSYQNKITNLKFLKMKRILFTTVTISALMIISITSCKKENDYPVMPPDPQPVSFELVANNWVTHGGDVYLNVFNGLLTSPNAGGNHKVTVYLRENDQLMEISQRPIMYLGNELWAISSLADITIMYRSINKLPFTDMHIRVEVR